MVPLHAFGHDPFRDIRLLNEKSNSFVKTFFDVGAHAGSTSFKALVKFPEARVFAFEPHPETFSRLADATKKYSAMPYRPLSARKLETSSWYTYRNSAINQRNIEKIDVLKIDTEGFDLEVLK